MLVIFYISRLYVGCAAVIVVPFLDLVLSLNGGRIYLILLERVLTPNLHLE